MWNQVTDEKRGERVRTIAGLPIGTVRKRLLSCFGELRDSSNVECIEWYVGLYLNVLFINLFVRKLIFPPWPEQLALRGRAVIPCSCRIHVTSDQQRVLDKLLAAVDAMAKNL